METKPRGVNLFPNFRNAGRTTGAIPAIIGPEVELPAITEPVHPVFWQRNAFCLAHCGCSITNSWTAIRG
ncbi:hypothetical protein Naga_100649g3 [Nannochloropsis gaditana]|uniref:Uncharacterized protein n=1 Tax=Nannochloropsis gaditana TaxID=72520 RepID=W7TI35_9STRA|nr:hypothetical protein Naga_100649g3 [Nannochloropsis gaditana]